METKFNTTFNGNVNTVVSGNNNTVNTNISNIINNLALVRNRWVI